MKKISCYLFLLNLNLIKSYSSTLFIERNSALLDILVEDKLKKANLSRNLFLKFPNVTIYSVYLMTEFLVGLFFQSSPVAKSVALTLLSDSYDRSIKLPYGTQKCIYLTAKNSCFDPPNQRRTIDVSNFCSANRTLAGMDKRVMRK